MKGAAYQTGRCVFARDAHEGPLPDEQPASFIRRRHNRGIEDKYTNIITSPGRATPVRAWDSPLSGHIGHPNAPARVDASPDALQATIIHADGQFPASTEEKASQSTL